MIAFFGGSITQQHNGYVDEFAKYWPEKKIRKFGFGAMHLSNAGICYIDKVIHYKPEFCFVDWFSTGYNDRNQKTIDYIDTIIYRFSEIGCRLVFLILPWEDADRKKEKKEFYDFVKDVLNSRGAAVLSLCEYFSPEDSNRILRDGIHTTEYGSKAYGKIIDEYFRENIDKLTVLENTVYTNYVKIKNISVEREYDKKIILRGNCEIVGFLLTIGPYSGIVQINTGDSTKKINTWDRWCYYPRKHFSFGMNIEKETTIEILNDSFDYSSCKKNVNFNEIQKKLVIHKIYFIGDYLHLVNIKDGKHIKNIRILLDRWRGRIIQKAKRIIKTCVSFIKPVFGSLYPY